MSSLPSTPSQDKGGNQAGTPGSWTHPKYEEILRRKENNTFADRQFKQLVRNGGALFLSFFGLKTIAESVIVKAILPSGDSLGSIQTMGSWFLLAARLLFVFNILQALAPLFLSPDLVEDIPLTPSQRQVLGLPPTPTSATPSQQDTSMYITPPRYNKNSPSASRSATPAGPSTPGSPSRSIGIGKTRVTSKGSPVPMGMGLGQSQYSGSSSTSGFDLSSFRSPSPVKNGLGNSERRSSFGSPSPKGMGIGHNSLAASMQSSVSPSVTVGAKWLFEQKNKRSQFM